MKSINATAFAALMLASLAAHAGTPVINLSIGGEISPGVYGQVQFGNASPPPILYTQPRIIVRQPAVEAAPRSICMCLRGTRRTGPSIAANTTPVTGRCIS